MQTGNNAEVKTIGVTWGFRTKEELLRHNPCLLADTPGEIYDAATQDIE
jgi:phosphoglycolate phosphatase